MYALVDCNNFFVSCERVFRPELRHVPVCVLSFNDGCIVARSAEVKALGVPMGAPLYQYEELLRHHGVVVCSANFALYGDMSRRVMETLTRFSPHIDYYSIDEAFLDFHSTIIADLPQYCRRLRDIVLQETGIPVSVGLGPTYTLAKAANSVAKRDVVLDGVCDSMLFPSFQQFLERIPVENVWGVGRRLTPLLHQYDIFTALDLSLADPQWIRRRFSVTLLRTVLELQGIPSCTLHSSFSQKTLLRSRGFGRPLSNRSDIFESLSTHISSAAASLRESHLAAWNMGIFLRPQYPTRTPTFFTTTFSTPTAYTPTFLHEASTLLDVLLEPGAKYKKSGVLFTGLVPDTCLQSALFTSPPYTPSQRRLMETIDFLNDSLGERTVFFGSSGTTRSWQGRCASRSQRFTTHFSELLTVRA